MRNFEVSGGDGGGYRTYRCVARGLARLHTVPLQKQKNSREVLLWPRMDQFIRLVPHSFHDPDKQVPENSRLLFTVLDPVQSGPFYRIQITDPALAQKQLKNVTNLTSRT